VFQKSLLLPLSATLMMGAASRTSEMLLNFYQVALHYSPEDSHLSINKLTFVMEPCYVFFAVWTEFLNIT
jgi:hypothetical protein